MNSSGIFRRATRRVLATIGEGSFLRGVAIGNVNIERGVQFEGQFQDGQFVRDVASIQVEYAPEKGDILIHPLFGSYKLDSLVDNDGYKKRYVILPIETIVTP